MNKTIYISGGWEDHETIIGYVERLNSIGWLITHNWMYQARDAKKKGDGLTDRHRDEEFRRSVAEEELAAIERASVFWFHAPSYRGAGGAWFEFGYATAIPRMLTPRGSVHAKKIFASGEHAKRSIFSSAYPVESHPTHDEVFDILAAMP